MRARLWIALAGVAGVVLIGFVAVPTLRGSLTYYREPHEIAGHAQGDHQVRLGGRVVPGSLEQRGSGVQFVLTDGRARVTVRSSTEPPGTFREGQDAVVQGTYDGTLFTAAQVIVKHSNVYRAKSGS